MKKALILAVCVFHVFSVWAGAGTRFREAVHSIDLTQPAADELKKVDLKEFEQLENPYRYLPELAFFPSGYMNHDQGEFARNCTQGDLTKIFEEKLSGASCPSTLKLKCGGQCTYDHENAKFSYVVQAKYTKAEYKHNPNTFYMSGTKKLKTYAETDEGILVLLLENGTIEAHEFFNRTMFTKLSLEQLVVLSNLYDISVSTKNGKIASIHQSWCEVYKAIPQKVKDFMFKVSTYSHNDITVVSLDGIPPLENMDEDAPPLEYAPQQASVLGYHGKTWTPKEKKSKSAKTE